MTVLLTRVSQMFAEQLPVCLAGGTAVVMLAWAMLRVSARHNAGVRFRVWFSALAAIAALLLLGGVHVNASSAAGTATGAHVLVEMPTTWALYGFIAWLALTCVALLRIAVGLWQVWRLKRSCVELDAHELDPLVLECVNAGSNRRIAICVSESVSAPTAIGLGRATIVLPSWAMTELSAADLKQVLLHEAAHLQRWDDWTNLAQKVLKALLIFHPLAWWVESRLTLEREMACDDVVLRHTGNPNAYAHCLATLAEKSFARRSVALAQAAVGRVRQTTLRVSRILHVKVPMEARGWASGMSLVAVFAFAWVLLSHTPTLIGFEDHMPATIAGGVAGSLGQGDVAAGTVGLSSVSAVHGAAHVAKQQMAGSFSGPIRKGGTVYGAHDPVPSYTSAKVMPATYVSADRGNKKVRRANSPDVRDLHLHDGVTRVAGVRNASMRDADLAASGMKRSMNTAEMLAMGIPPTMNRARNNGQAIIEQAVFTITDGQANSASAVVWQVTVWRVTVSQERSPLPREVTPKKT